MRPQLHCSVENSDKSVSSQPTVRTQTFPHRRIFQVAIFVHVLSLFACSTASSGLSSYKSESSTPCPAVSGIPHVGRNKSEQCLVWSERTSSEMCALSPEDRVRRFRATYLFPDLQPISLYSIFSAGSSSESWSRRLLSGIRGSDCVRETGALCRACFDRLATALRRLDDAYRSFDQTLFRFDCMPAVDTASATRPFSPNGSCTTCRSWYKRWLLVQTISIWREPPCVNWCYYAQLACPHLATSKVVDYAGHPSFQCRDQDIPLPQEPEALRCSCVHPCDLRGIVADGELMRTPTAAHDFYPSRQHCDARRRQCARTTAHDRRVSREPPTFAAAAAAARTMDGGVGPLLRHFIVAVLLAVAVIQ
ncbi:hypothetical protein Q1695_000358 [Nippostrongylus brasiliensis]|nr:hypothetical protein Q1695_000358 [Nippostrongylus brasiliensis]